MVERTRSRYWVDRQIQGAIAVRVSIHWLVFTSIAAVLTLMIQYMSDPFKTFSAHLDTAWRNQGSFVIVMLILLPIFLYDTIKLSNRFAGPVLRLRRVMNEIAEGKPAERLEFRDNDFWRGMAKDFNALIDHGHFETSQPSPLRVERTNSSELQEVS